MWEKGVKTRGFYLSLEFINLFPIFPILFLDIFKSDARRATMANLGFAIPNMITNYKLDNYDMSKVDNAKLTRDMQNGISVAERRRRCVNGYYDKK